jgi:transcriptional regulator with XRE-family HTH domain
MDWSQEMLAREAHVTGQTVSHWETGKHEPIFEHRAALKKLALRVGFPESNWPLKKVAAPRIVTRADSIRPRVDA